MDNPARADLTVRSPPSLLLTSLLKDVSRSFYLTMRVLPNPIRPQISLTYLLARLADTIADTKIVPPAQRLQALRALRERIQGTRLGPLNLGDLVSHQASPSEHALLERVEEALGLLADFSGDDRERIRDVLAIITGGQELDLNRFGGATPDRIIALQTDRELDDYTYRVAGCVGEFWTRICQAHLFQGALVNEPFLMSNAVRFGKGLQWVNVLRDLPSDLREGRCYLPVERLSAHGLAPADLLAKETESRFRPLYNAYLGLAEDHLAAGWTYTNALPRRCVRVRLACAWPLLIGVRTLEKLRSSNVLDARQRIKISRAEIRSLVFRTVLYYPWNNAWQRLFQPAKR